MCYSLLYFLKYVAAQPRRKPTLRLVLAVALGRADLLEGVLSWLSAKEKLSQERLFQAGSWSRRERSTSATNLKVWKLLRAGSRNITEGFRANGRKSFSVCKAGIHPFLYKKFYFSCRFFAKLSCCVSYRKFPKTGHCLGHYCFCFYWSGLKFSLV